jgi:hypothetical protein
MDEEDTCTIDLVVVDHAGGDPMAHLDPMRPGTGKFWA